jgi:hypothetical protein
MRNDMPLTENKPAMAANELTEARKYKEIVRLSCEKYLLRYPTTGQPITSIIAGIISRESAWGWKLKPPGPKGTGDKVERPLNRIVGNGERADYVLPPDDPPDDRLDRQLGFGRGLGQLDYDWDNVAAFGEWWKPEINIDHCCSILRNYLDYHIGKDLLSGNDLIRGMVASYNCGPRMVLKALKANLDIDAYTTGHNYSAGVLIRAEVFIKDGWT